MQSTFNPVQLLAEVSSCHKTGGLNIKTKTAAWNIFFDRGEFIYAENSVQTLTQLQYFLVKNGWQEALGGLKTITKIQPPNLSGGETGPSVSLFEYAISNLHTEGYLDELKIQRLIEEISQDALETFLWIQSGGTLWVDAAPPPAWIHVSMSQSEQLDLSDMLQFLQQRLRGWQNCTDKIISPYQRPYLLDFHDINKPVADGAFSAHTLSKLSELMRRGLSLRQLSLYLKQDELHVAQMLSPYIRHQIIFLRNPQPPFDKLPNIPRDKLTPPDSSDSIDQPSGQTYKVVCIDDSPTVLSEMKRFLHEDYFEVITIADPVQASAMLFRLKPDLILMDITMPRINGYRLCSLLRSSAVFDTTPIIMVSGNTGLIDKARAKISGATDYLTKPFNHDELTGIVNKYLQLN